MIFIGFFYICCMDNKTQINTTIEIATELQKRFPALLIQDALALANGIISNTIQQEINDKLEVTIGGKKNSIADLLRSIKNK